MRFTFKGFEQISDCRRSGPGCPSSATVGPAIAGILHKLTIHHSCSAFSNIATRRACTCKYCRTWCRRSISIQGGQQKVGGRDGLMVYGQTKQRHHRQELGKTEKESEKCDTCMPYIYPFVDFVWRREDSSSNDTQCLTTSCVYLFDVVLDDTVTHVVSIHIKCWVLKLSADLKRALHCSVFSVISWLP